MDPVRGSEVDSITVAKGITIEFDIGIGGVATFGDILGTSLSILSALLRGSLFRVGCARSSRSSGCARSARAYRTSGSSALRRDKRKGERQKNCRVLERGFHDGD